jgi:5'-nucleotidase / UDP-sugar diphosphatase
MHVRGIRKSLKTALNVFFILGLLAIPALNNALLGTPANVKKNGTTKIIIFHVNDMHAKIDNFDNIAWLVANERKKNPETDVLFFNAGDNFSGNPVVDQAEPKGKPAYDLLNLMGIDAMSIGNHEFDYGQQVLAKFIKYASFPLLCANINVNKSVSKLPQPKPYTILKTKNGFKVAVLSLIQVSRETGIPATHPNNLKGITFSNPYKVAEKYTHLKEKSDVFIALTHLGIEGDEKLAKQMGQLDLIIGGHSHTLVNKPVFVNNVLIAQAGGDAKHLGRIELILENGKIVKKSSKIINVKNLKQESPQLKKMIDKFNDNPVLKKALAQLPVSIMGKMELGNLITDGMRKLYNLDIAVHNNGGIRSRRLPKKVTLKDVYKLHPFGNEIVQFEMTPAEIRSLLINDFQSHRGLDLQVSGIQLIVTAKGSKVKAINITDLKGKPLDDNKTYKVGMNNYISASYKFDHKDPGKSLMVNLAQTTSRYIKEGKNITDGIDQRRTFVTILPSKNWKKIGSTPVKISAGNNRYAGSSTSGNLVTDAIRSATGADIATYPSNLLQSAFIIKADTSLYKEYIRKLYKFSNKNKAVTAAISGKDLKAFLVKRCRYQGNADLQVSGMTYNINLDAGGKVSSIDCYLSGGKKLSDSKIYKVTFNDYEFKNKYKLDRNVKSHTLSTQTVEQMVADYITKKGTLPTSIREKRIKVLEKK